MLGRIVVESRRGASAPPPRHASWSPVCCSLRVCLPSKTHRQGRRSAAGPVGRPQELRGFEGGSGETVPVLSLQRAGMWGVRASRSPLCSRRVCPCPQKQKGMQKRGSGGPGTRLQKPRVKGGTRRSCAWPLFRKERAWGGRRLPATQEVATSDLASCQVQGKADRYCNRIFCHPNFSFVESLSAYCYRLEYSWQHITIFGQTHFHHPLPLQQIDCNKKTEKPPLQYPIYIASRFFILGRVLQIST